MLLIDIFLIHKIFIFSINIISIYLFYLVYFSNTRPCLKKVFVLMIISMLLWVNFAYLARATNYGTDISLSFLKIAWFVTPIFFLLLYFFTIYLIQDHKKHYLLSKTVLFLGIIISFITGLSSLIVKDIEFINDDMRIIYGDAMFPFLLITFFIICATLYPLIKKYLKVSLVEKTKIAYFLIGIFVFYLANIIFNIVLPLFFDIVRFYYIGDYSIILFLILTAYAITKHELMGIKTLITQVLIVVISLILFIDVILLSDNITMQLLKIGILLAFLYFSRGMVESVKNEKKAREELEKTYQKINVYIKRLKKININLKEKNEDLGALLKVSDVAMDTLNSRKIAQNIVDSIPINLKHLGYRGGILVLYDRKKEMVYTYALTESEIVKKAKKLLSKSLVKYAENIDKVDNLVIKTIKTKEMQIGNKLEDFIAPTVNKKICKLIQKIVGAKSFISVPIFSGGRVKGTIVFVGIKPKSKIVQRDKDILLGFSSHIGATIENAQLYEQTEKQIKALSILNENLKMANIRLKELMEMKNEFLHITSHQLRTPLTTIRGMIAMWHNGDFDNLSEKEKKKMLKRIYISSERLNNITNDMLDSLELEGGLMKFQFKKMSLREIMKETVDIMRPNFDKKNLYLKFNDNADIPKIEVEPNYVRQVFMNIIDNACKYTRKGGAEINIKKSGKYVEIIIKDTGIGVSKSDQKKIFQKFTRGKKASIENASGSGLGLFIAKKIVDAHNGKVKFSSEGSGKGSVVKILLPVEQR